MAAEEGKIIGEPELTTEDVSSAGLSSQAEKVSVVEQNTSNGSSKGATQGRPPDVQTLIASAAAVGEGTTGTSQSSVNQTPSIGPVPTSGAATAGPAPVKEADDGSASYIHFSAPEFTTGKTVSTSAEIGVSRTGNVSGTASVDYGTSDVSAVAGNDYSSATGTLTFNSGETKKTFNVGILKQPTSGKLNLILELMNAQRAALGSPSKSVLTIHPAMDSQLASETSSGSPWYSTVIQYLIFALMGGAFVYFIIHTGGIIIDSPATGLNTLETARSLITFLIAASTVGIALVLALAAIIGSGSEMKERFSQGKEILTVLIGVLGTIVGFYFGQTTKATPTSAESNVSQTANLQISPATISNLTPSKGEKTVITAKTTGGRPPYKYTITFLPSGIIPDIKDGNSADGSINQEVVIPQDLKADTPITFKITVADADGKTVTYDDPKRQFIAKVSSSILGL